MTTEDETKIDHIRESVIAAAEARGFTAYEISKRLGGSPNNEAVKRYLMRRCHLGTQHVSKICTVLGLTLKQGKAK